MENQTWSEDKNIAFPTTLWWIWKWRNNRCFNRVVDIPIDQMSFILGGGGSIKQAMNKEELLLGKCKRGMEKIFVRYLCPREGWVRLNMDVVVKENPRKDGCGGIIRGHRREFTNFLLLDVGCVRVLRLNF